MSPTTSAPHHSLNLWTESTFLTRFLSGLLARPAQTSPTLALTPPPPICHSSRAQASQVDDAKVIPPSLLCLLLL